jgi:hypothetical protein
MSNYTQTTNFATKDALASGNPLKVVKGTEINVEFANIATAVATKSDLVSPTFTGTVTIPTLAVTGTSTLTGVATLTSQPILSSLTASKPVFTDASKGLVSTGTLGADQGGTGVANNAAMTVTGSGNFAYTRTLTGATNVTLPTTGTLATLAGTETFTNKTLTSPTLTTPDINSAQIPTVSGTAPLYMARAWVNFNGTGTVAIRASGNVSTISDNGTGNYTVNFTSAIVDANYACTVGLGNDSGSGANGSWAQRVGASRSTTSIQILCARPDNGALADASDSNVAIFR